MRGQGRTARVYTNLTCNQGCAFCDRRAPRERRSFVAPAAVRQRIDTAASGASTLVLTGGEPTLRRDLASLVAHAVSRGLRVELEKNAALVTPELARALRRAGLAIARVHLPGWGEDGDRVTRDPGGFAATARGVASLRAEGLPVEVAAPVVRANEHTLAALPAQLSAAGWEVEALVLGVPTRAPDDRTLLPLERAAATVAEVVAAAAEVDLEVRIDPHTPVPPCAFAQPAGVTHLLALTPGGRVRDGWSQRPACAACVVADRCPGAPIGAAFRPRPLRQAKLRRRLSLVSTVRSQIERELFQDEIVRHADGTLRRARTVRVGFRCNQACSFCFVSTHLPSAAPEAIAQAIAAAARRGDTINLSGGEPLLDPRLERWVRLAKDEGSPWVELQTNATRIDPPRARTLRAAGVDVAFVSLHGATAETSDAVTGAPGTFARTCEGVDALLAAGLPVRLNFVICGRNMAEFPAHVAHVARRWPRAELCVSFVAPSTDLVPRTAALIPRLSDVLPHLREGLRLARVNGLRVSGLHSMCGIPLCLVPSDLSEFFGVADVPAGYGGEEVLHPPVCDGCALRAKCFGVRRGYVELHGTGELCPVRDRAGP